ncbi:T9SS type A sorting domain-containing protein [Altibacter sp. HG106]|uniref:T9SS type A sorting domain-containing protein n=1 Tax=Altibacter sp. HG106 TaxID=3023937 RepID=UPI0023504121|nr:T9SS type A sorting domain-containing protein [Altibacter sp. HG106]MDC7996141.1 T9SS type A sorting domain-containing protein [Altibacter sp. HG106]
MKKIVFLLLMFTGLIASAQFGPQQIISTSDEGPYYAIPVDVDSDGFIDVLSASNNDYSIEWFRNLDGLGNFGPKNVINDSSGWVLSMEWTDVDGDGDNDILYLRNNPEEIAWLENQDGQGTFSSEQLLDYSVSGSILNIQAIDLDDDGDLDIVSTVLESVFEHIVWFENVGDGSLSAANYIAIEFFMLGGLTLADIDNDGWKDIVVSDNNNDPAARIIWFKNQGDTTFAEAQPIYQFQMLRSDWTQVEEIQYEDFNSDGKKDLFIVGRNADIGDSVSWLENLDNLGAFGELHSIDSFPGGYTIGDIDNDNDQDLLVRYRTFDEIIWLENENGLGTFDTERFVTTEVDFPRDAQLADFNGDGLLDVVSASTGDGKLAWYENTGVFNVTESSIAPMLLYPNPAKSNITVTTQETPTKIIVYNLMGQSVAVFKNTRTVDVSLLSQGNYLLTIEGPSGDRTVHRMIKE